MGGESKGRWGGGKVRGRKGKEGRERGTGGEGWGWIVAGGGGCMGQVRLRDSRE